MDFSYPKAKNIIQSGQPSRSAFMVATLRAAHQIVDHPVVFDDPLALSILGSDLEAQIRTDPSKFNTAFSKILRASMAVRSRFTEDALSTAIEAGVTQYVVLGAGLDTFAYRHQETNLHVFEVDHPSTQTWKRELLQASSIAVPKSLTYVPADFEKTTLAEVLNKAGCRMDLPIFFSWLGVTLYLSHDAIFHILKLVASCPKGSAIAFDYGVTPTLLNARERMGIEHFAKKYAEQGEPWISYFDPVLLAQELETVGFTQLNDMGADELKQRYLNNRKDGLSIGRGTRIMLAHV